MPEVEQATALSSCLLQIKQPSVHCTQSALSSPKAAIERCSPGAAGAGKGATVCALPTFARSKQAAAASVQTLISRRVF